MSNIQNLGNARSSSDLYAYFKKLDKNNDGQIDLKTEAPEADRKALEQADDEYFIGNGKVSMQELLKDKTIQSQIGLNDLNDLKALLEVEKLLEPLANSKDMALIEKTGNTLRKINNPAAIPALIQALSSPHDDIRHNAGKALADIKDPAIVPALIDAIKDGDGNVRYSAALAFLGHIEDPTAVSELVNASKNSDEAIRLGAVKTINTLFIMGIKKNPILISAVTDALQDSNEKVRSAATDALEGIKNTSTTPAPIHSLRIENASHFPVLIDAFKNSNSNVRYKAVQILSNRKDPAVVPVLINALKDSDERVQRMAAWGLGNSKETFSIPALINALGDSNSDVRNEVTAALNKMDSIKESQSSAVAQAITNLLEKNEDDASLKIQVINTTSNLKNFDATPILINALKDKDERVRSVAIAQLGKINAPIATAALFNALQDSDADIRKSVARGLASINNPSVVPALIETLKHDRDEGVRGAVISSLGEIKDLSAIPALMNTVTQIDTDEKTRKFAISALAGFNNPETTRELMHTLKDSDSDTREWAVNHLKNRKDSSSVPALIEMLNDEENFDRSMVAEALGEIKDKRAEPALAKLANKLWFFNRDNSAVQSALSEIRKANQ